MRQVTAEPVTENSAQGYFNQFLDNEAPILVCDCIAFLRNRGLFDVGVFRIPGSKETIFALKEAYDVHFATKHMKDTSNYSVLNEITPTPAVNDVASLLKAFFKELNPSVIPENVTKQMMEVVKGSLDVEEIAVGLTNCIEGMPRPNRECLGLLMSFLREICTFKSYNQMGAENLATCFVLSVFGHGNTVNQLHVLGLGAVVIKHLIMLPVRLYMPSLENIQKNTMYKETGENLESPTITKNKGDGINRKNRTLRDKKVKKGLKYKQSGTRVMAQPIKIAKLVAETEEPIKQFRLQDFEHESESTPLAVVSKQKENAESIKKQV